MTKIKIVGLKSGVSSKTKNPYYTVHWLQPLTGEGAVGDACYTSFVGEDIYNECSGLYGKEVNAVCMHFQNIHKFEIIK